MEQRVAIAAHAVLDKQSGVSVVEFCKERGVSRQQYYVYRRRLEQEGLAGLVPRSRRPHASPGVTAAEVVDLIVAKHDELIAQGWDAGARSVREWLITGGHDEVPSVRTCHKILAEHQRTSPTPTKRPRSSFRRFEAMQPNGVWQLDGHSTLLAEGRAVVLRFQDDHSRAIMSSRAAPSENGQDTWAALIAGIERHGKPAFIQCDNSKAFTARLTNGGGYSEFEARLHRIGVGMINSSPRTPRTNGKKEREWQTLERWLAARPRASTLKDLQRLLDAYDLVFNTQRPHQGIDGVIPIVRYHAGQKATPDPKNLTKRQYLHTVTLGRGGYFDLPGARVAFGAAWAGAEIEYLLDLDRAVLFHDGKILAQIPLDADATLERHPARRTRHRVKAKK